jgi:hypothetical protein
VPKSRVDEGEQETRGTSFRGDKGQKRIGVDEWVIARAMKFHQSKPTGERKVVS